MRKSDKKADKEKSSKVGGIFFFSSLISLVAIATLNTRFLISVLAAYPFRLPLILTAAACCGWLIARVLIRGHVATFIHELKHAVVSNLVGNKAKEMRIRRNSGHFQYEYTSETRRYNAFISLAPYCFPLFMVPTLGALAWVIPDRMIVVALVGCALGIDLQCGWRDVSPHQTDFSDLHGGYTVGLIYVIAASVTLITIMLAWAAAGWEGPAHLGSRYLLTLGLLVHS